VEAAIAAYPEAQLHEDVKQTFSFLRESIEEYSRVPGAFKKIVSPKGRSPLAAFYAVFMSFFRLLVQKGLSLEYPKGMWEALEGVHKRLEKGRHYTTSKDRERNIAVVTGLIENFFVKKDRPALGHGAALAVDFENSLRRSKVETARYEFKQGVLSLDKKASLPDKALLDRIVATICAIANVGPEADGYLYIGVADRKQDADQITKLYGTAYETVSDRFVVGVDRETKAMNCSMDGYLAKMIGHLRNSDLSEPLKAQVLNQIDVVEFRGLSVVRIRVPRQSGMSFVGKRVFVREGNSTIEITNDPQRIVAVSGLFPKLQ